jgi:hypothetical protein
MSAASNVWFIPVDDGDDIPLVAERLKTVLIASGFRTLLTKNITARVKMHFGDEGNTGHVRPELVRVIADLVAEQSGITILSDTNTLYRGRRSTSREHRLIAGEHRFTSDVTGALLEIPDDNDPETVRTVACSGRFITAAKVMRCFTDADLLVGVAHFKGHLMTGFGGALKNIGMGCASREGKFAQHGGVAPFILANRCTGCGACVAVCPADAIALVNDIAVLDTGKCIGCASCYAACKNNTIEVDWGRGAGVISGRMVEYAGATLAGVCRRVFINAALHITAECDCLAKDDPRIVPDIGILAATDPVAIDQACYDLSCRSAGGYDPFSKAHPGRNATLQLDYAEQLGIGRRNYELIKVPV